MRQTAWILTLVLAAGPAASEEETGRSLLERGAELFLEGLLQEMEPALDEMQELGAQLTPSFRNFMAEMGPALTQLFDKVEDWSRYHPPEILENGDVIIRRKQDLPAPQDDVEI